MNALPDFGYTITLPACLNCRGEFLLALMLSPFVGMAIRGLIAMVTA